MLNAGASLATARKFNVCGKCYDKGACAWCGENDREPGGMLCGDCKIKR